MNVLQLISSVGFFGAENVVLNLSVACATMGIKSSVGVIAGAGFTGWPRGAGACRPHIFPSSGRIDTRCVTAIRDFVRKNGISVVHSHNYKSDVYALLATACLRTFRIATCHNWISPSVKMRAYESLDKLALRAFNAVVPVSVALASELALSGIPERKITVIPNGIAFPPALTAQKRLDLRRGMGIGPEEKTIVSVGRLSAEKGHDMLVKAFSLVVRACPTARCVIVGDGPQRLALAAEARRLGVLPRVVFTGFREDAAAMSGIGDVFVLPSLTEGMPLALLEAMAAGVPVVATAVGAVAELTGQKGEFGCLVRPADPGSLAAAIVRTLNDPKTAGEKAAAARERVAREYSSVRMARAYARIYGSG